MPVRIPTPGFRLMLRRCPFGTTVRYEIFYKLICITYLLLPIFVLEIQKKRRTQ
ncbi:hypothetical protein Barb6_00593 [Bacteroidales bacterium Barb6]|nr:hypothetical protein Barb6_00593 [Bacteroidales bacterium Barb6]